MSSQALADAALAFLSLPADQPGLSPLPVLKDSTLTGTVPAVSDTPASLSVHQHESSDAVVSNESPTETDIEKPSTPLPSLLRYADHILMRSKNVHDHPPHATQTCVSCNIQWNNAGVSSAFLPLSPCNHWVHYRCLIWLATHNSLQKDRCPACKKQLFEWDGVSALTLATRTSLPMGNEQFTTMYPGTHALVTTDRTEYEQECQFIDSLISSCFFTQLTQTIGFADSSPDLVQCFNNVLNHLRLMGRPTSRWLKWSTSTGSLLFGMLVAIKMRRLLVEGYGSIRQTEAWIAWEDGYRSLQRRILEEVHKE